jgi:hypothetical protein
MIEKRWAAVPPQAFTSDGTADGKITVANSVLFKVKQIVILASSANASRDDLEVKRITDKNTIYIGPKGGNIDARVDLSGYLVADGAFIAANEQLRSKVPEQDVERNTYEEEPAVARRVIGVDQLGNPWNETNPMPVTATFDGDVQVGSVRITAQDNDPVAGDIHSSVRVSDGTDDLAINSDGSINVNIVSSPDDPGLILMHNEITSVASGSEVNIMSFTAPPSSNYRVFKIDVSGSNIAQFRVRLNGAIVSTLRTYFSSSLNDSFVYEPFENGLKLAPGDVVRVTVIHGRPNPGDFEVTMMASNI